MKIVKFYTVLLVSILLSSGIGKTYAQTRFQKTYGGGADEVAWSVIQTTDLGYLICGYTTSFGNGGRDAYVIKTDSLGAEQWSKSFGGNLNDEATYALEDNGTYLVGGYTKSYGAGNADGFISRLDASGNIIWFKTLGTPADDSHLLRFHKTTDNGIILVYPYKYSGLDSYSLIKTDNNGTMQWSRTYGGTQANISGDVIQFPDSGYLVSGSSLAYGKGLSDLLVTRMDSLGNIVWSKTIGTTTNETGGFSLIRINNSDALVTGQRSNGSFGANDVVVAKINYLTGAVSIMKEYGTAGRSFQTYSGAFTQDSGFVFSVNDYSATATDMRILRTDSAGNVAWMHTYGGAANDAAYGMCSTTDKGFAVVGYTYSYGAGGADIYFVKTTEYGESSCFEPPVSVQAGLWNEAETSPAIPQVYPNDFYFSSAVATSAITGEMITDICFRTQATGCTCSGLGPELVINGDFSAGNSSFTSDYTYASGSGYNAGTYGMTNDPSQNNTGWDPCPDHTTGTGNMLWVNASDLSTGLSMWKETFTVTPSTNYLFSYWFENICITDSIGHPPGDVSFTINGVLQGNLLKAPYSSCQWVQDCNKWNSGSATTATVSIVSMSAFGGGDDFGIDDISFRECLGAPTTDFVSSDTAFCNEGGKCIDFFDHSSGSPTSWKWFFPGAVPDTSSQQNPSNICYDNPGTYGVTLIVTNASGSDTLTISPMITFATGATIPILTLSHDTIFCSHEAAYQWYFNGTPIAGATDSFYIATNNGTYNVYITNNLGCSRLGDGILYNSVYEIGEGLAFEVYPNPATQSAVINLQSTVGGSVQISIINVLGEIVFEQPTADRRLPTVIEVSSFVKGVYFIKVKSEKGEWIGKMVKE